MTGELIVIQGNYKDDTAVENVICYVAESVYADYDEIISNDVDMTSTDSIIDSFLKVQEQAYMPGHKRLFHLILSAPGRAKQINLDRAAKLTVDYFERKEFQCIAVPHYGSRENYMNFHYHVIINAISLYDGKRFYGRNQDFELLRHYLDHYTPLEWSLRFKRSSNYRKP